MIVKAIKTRVMQPPKDDLLQVCRESISSIKERSVIVITSKVISIWQGRCIPSSSVQDKDELIIKEAEKYLPREHVPGGWVMHTIKNNLLIPTAGIDESNSADHYILWPDHMDQTVKELHRFLKETFSVKEIGVIISDSHSIALRRGVVGISLAHYGFRPLNDYRKTVDLFDREMKISQTNVADGLAASAVLCMGEGKEATPIAIIEDVPFVEFTERLLQIGDPYSSFEVSLEQDLYAPFIQSVPWKEGGEKTK